MMNLAQWTVALLFVLTFAAILSERVHRTIVAMTAAAMMLIVGMVMGFYTQEEALKAIDFNTLGLLLGMMILVRLLEGTGFFRYVAILISKRSGGHPWPLMVALGTATMVLSMFLDNVTTVVLIVPVTILIAEILGIPPTPLLMAEALLSNIGGLATLVGDPPNILIGSAAGFTFNSFLTHLAPLALVAWGVALLVLRVAFRRELAQRSPNVEALARLREDEALHDRAGLRRVLLVMAVVILLFFLEGRLHLKPAFIALSGAAAALLWARPNLDETLQRVEWNVLLFFAALFVTIGGLEASGVLGLLAGSIEGLTRARPLVAGLAFLWVAAIVSAVVDNVPFTIALIPVIQRLASLHVNVWSLWWALALGAGLGGNGTPIGSTASVITVALSERTRAPITSRVWLRSGLPVTLATCLVISLLFALLFGWMSVP